MRKIKFKYWDSEKNIMYKGSPFLAMDDTGEVSELIFHDEYLEWRGTYYTGHIKPIQYTGLNDKKDIEIYEGDIIKIYADTDIDGKDLYYYGEVKYLEGSYIIKFTAGGEEYLCDYVSEAKVVGNIYENPELLDYNHD